MADIEQKVRDFIAENFLFRTDKAFIGDDASLLDGGLIDSIGVLELVAFIEKDFHLSLADAEIVPENLDSIKAIVTFVRRKLVQPRGSKDSG